MAIYHIFHNRGERFAFLCLSRKHQKHHQSGRGSERGAIVDGTFTFGVVGRTLDPDGACLRGMRAGWR